MKKDIHPKYHPVKFVCACGATFVAGSTIESDEFHTEICSNCHPFFTGKQKLVDSSGRVEKFKAKMEKVKKAQSEGSKKVQKVPVEELDKAVAAEEVAEEEAAEESGSEEEAA